MKLFAIALVALSLLSAPAFASRTCVGGTGDHANHQSSLSSTTEGGSVGYCRCDN